jgi:hypothetical protein
MEEVGRSQETLQRWDPRAIEADDLALRRQEWLTISTRTLVHARAAAIRAAALARTRQEKWEVALVLARLEHSAGNHQEELRQARRLLVLEPGDQRSLIAFRTASQCNGLTRLEQTVDGMWNAGGRTEERDEALSPGPAHHAPRAGNRRAKKPEQKASIYHPVPGGR